WSPGLTSLRRCAMLPASRSWRTDHVDHLACLPDRVHGHHNVRLWCIGERFDFDARRGGHIEILRAVDLTNIWRPYDDRHCGGFAAAAADRPRSLTCFWPAIGPAP